MMEPVASGESKLSPSAAAKKMKQSRLPFQVLVGSPTSPVVLSKAKAPSVESRKRKPSLETEGLRAAKIGRISEVKENVKDTAPVVILDDDESNSADLIDVRKEDQKLVVVKVDSPRTPRREIGEPSGETGKKSVGKEKSAGKQKSTGKEKSREKGEKIMIKLPMGKKKGKKEEAGEEATDAKKLNKEKKKHKKASKAKKGNEDRDAADIAVVIDDSDLSDNEQEAKAEGESVLEEKTVGKKDSEDKLKDETKACEEPSKTEKERKVTNKVSTKSSLEEKTAVDGKEEKNGQKNEKPEEANEQPTETKSTEEKPTVIDKHEKVEEKSEKSEESTELPEKNTVAEQDDASSVETENNTEEEQKDEQPPKESSKDDKNDKQPSEEAPKGEQSPEENKKEEEKEKETITPRRSRLSRAASQKPQSELKDNKKSPKAKTSSKQSASPQNQETSISTHSGIHSSEEMPVENKKDFETPKREKLSRAASSKKKEDSKEESKSEKDDKKKKIPSKAAEEEKKPVKGALDKFFVKVQADNKAAPFNGMISSVKDREQSKEPKDAPKTPEKVDSSKPEAAVGAMEVDQEPNQNNSTIVSICLDDSSDNNAADDEENAYMLCTPNSKDRSLVLDANQEKKLTPKQIARRKEAELRQALKQQELDEKKRKKQEEKDAKQREKEEQERLRKKEREEKEEQKRKEREEKEEQKRKEKEEKEEQKRKEKEEKEKKRLAELEAKNEEKRKKEEQKEEERKKKEEEKEAEEKRKQKTAQAFQSFFVKKTTGKDVKLSDDENSMEQVQFVEGETVKRTFMPFCVKGDMRLAPVIRTSLAEGRKKRLDEILRKSSDENGNSSDVARSVDELYLAQLKKQNYVAGQCDRTWIAEEDDVEDDDVMIIDDDVCHQIEEAAAPAKRYRAKFFLFEENRRPPYRGTWGKRSANIKPRRPFAQDTKFFDYEVDSDDEWEEEEPGESLHGSDDEKDVDPEEDYEVDNDFFVPHGHLSDEELQAEDDVMDDNSPETQKAKLKIMQQEFAAEMKKKTEKIKPRLIGCIWENASVDGVQKPECSAVIWEILKARAMLFDSEEPISFTIHKNDPESNHSSPSKEKEVTERKLKQVKLVDEGVKELITLIHGCALNRKFLIKEFLAYWAKRRDEGEFNVPQFAPDSIRIKISEISSWRPCPDEGPMQNKMCWYVNKEALVKYGLTDLKAPTGWSFILKPITKSKKEKKEKEGAAADDEEKKTPPKKESTDVKEKSESSQPASSSKPTKSKKPASSITKFTKTLSEDEKRKQFAKAKKGASSPGPSSSKSARTPKASPAASTASSKPNGGASKRSTPDGKPQPKKRVQLLMSVPRGQSVNQAIKNNLISQFLAKGDSDSKAKKIDTSSSTDQEKMEVDPPNNDQGGDEVIVLDD